MGLDLCGWEKDKGDWAPLILAAEHENQKWKISYSVWKVMSVDVSYRVVVTYFDNTIDSMIETDIRKVLEHNKGRPDKSLLLMAAKNRKLELSDKWDQVFERKVL